MAAKEVNPTGFVAAVAANLTHEVVGMADGPLAHLVIERQRCNRLRGHSAADCVCRLAGGGWAKCPPSARGIRAALTDQGKPAIRGLGFSGDCCDHCGLFTMVRTGTCLTCQSCGSSSGGCS
jgi:hypothetical protein